MKKLLFLLLFFAQKSWAENQITPKTTEVTVYRQGAKLTSEASAKIPSGASEVIFENLSPSFNAASLQVKIKGSAELISAIFQLKNPDSPAEPPRAQRLRDSLVLFGDRLADFRAEKETLADEATFIKNAQSRVGNSTEKSSNLSLEEFQKLVAFYSKRLFEIKNRQLAIERLDREINLFYQKTQQILQDLHPNAGNQTGQIVLKIQSPVAQTIEIACIYLVNSASWSPIYDLRAEGLDKPLKLVYKANISNNSGFDWSNVRLRLSTSQPLANNDRPILYPVFVDFRPIYAFKNEQNGQQNSVAQLNSAYAGRSTIDGGNVTIRGSRDNSTNYYIDGIRVANPNAPPVMDAEKLGIATGGLEMVFGDAAGGELVEADFLADFEIEKPQTITANGEQNVVTVKTDLMPCIFEHHAVPKLEAAVFLLAKVPDYGKFNLLLGTANLFLEETFVGQAQINPQITSDTLLLSMGRDEQVTVRRTKPKDVKERKKIFDKTEREFFEYEIVVKNQKSSPIRIEILDQIPVSKNEEIKVELEEKDGAAYNQEIGKLSWRIDLAGGASRKMRFSYSIKRPKDKPVSIQKG